MLLQEVVPGLINTHNVGVWMAAAPIHDPYGGDMLTNHGSLTTLQTTKQREHTAAILGLAPRWVSLSLSLSLCVCEREREREREGRSE